MLVALIFKNGPNPQEWHHFPVLEIMSPTFLSEARDRIFLSVSLGIPFQIYSSFLSTNKNIQSNHHQCPIILFVTFLFGLIPGLNLVSQTIQIWHQININRFVFIKRIINKIWLLNYNCSSFYHQQKGPKIHSIKNQNISRD